MYGIVNKAIEELVSETFGPEKWILVKEKSVKSFHSKSLRVT